GLFHPTFLYESLWDIGVAILVWQLDRRYRFGRGRAFALYVMAYTVGRFWIEAMRDDTAHHFLGMRLNNWTSIIVFLGALVYFLRVRGPQERLVATETGEFEVRPIDGAASTPTITDSQPSTDSQSPADSQALSDGAAPDATVDKVGDADLVDVAEPDGKAGPPTPATAGETRPSNQ
ncbi:MAG: prolipoprotein diacylglyceryl transferase, partial [Dactylosporangium sp.]|nr:prolipoprotein diacylglyceryl transferase [Dactylosporangium sp.]